MGPFIGISSFGEAISAAGRVAVLPCSGIVVFVFRDALIERLKRCFKRDKKKKKRSAR